MSLTRSADDERASAALVILAADDDLLADLLATRLCGAGFSVRARLRPDPAHALVELRDVAADAVVYVPSVRPRSHAGPDLGEAARAFALAGQLACKHLVLVSSAEVYGASPRNPGLMTEARPIARDAKNAISRGFAELERLARARLPVSITLTVLRPCPVPLRGRQDYFTRLFSQGPALTLAGHDPSIQALHPEDFVTGVACALGRSRGGVFNLAPDGVIPLRAALRLCARVRVPVPRSVRSAARRLWQRTPADPLDQLDYIRYSFTVSNQKSREELGFEPRYSCAQALLALGDAAPALPAATRRYDDFGLDPNYIARASRGLFEFMADHYWRIEVEGLEHVPRQGKAVLAGLHRGLIAWDAVMVMHVLAQRLGRHPRFLVHPTAFQFPFVFDLTTKLGGLVACQENADYVLEGGELLGIFPEGMRGVFSLYRDAYRLRKFGRHDFVKIALRNRAPIVAFVIVGSAETYPILGKVEWRWLQRKTEWPFFPLTPTLFPLMPAPLPSKWYLRFLPPVELGDHPPEAARDNLLVRSISDGVKHEMQTAIDELTARRRSIFSGTK